MRVFAHDDAGAMYDVAEALYHNRNVFIFTARGFYATFHFGRYEDLSEDQGYYGEIGAQSAIHVTMAIPSYGASHSTLFRDSEGVKFTRFHYSICPPGHEDMSKAAQDLGNAVLAYLEVKVKNEGIPDDMKRRESLRLNVPGDQS